MEQYWEYHDGRNSTIFELHTRLTIELLEYRMQVILADTGVFDPDEIELHIDLGPFKGTVIYGVIRTKRGRIFELHILDHPIALHAALLGANGSSRLPNHTTPESIN